MKQDIEAAKRRRPEPSPLIFLYRSALSRLMAENTEFRMRLPNVKNAEITEAKIVRYLLSTSHRAGKSKAAFFMQFGFIAARWDELAAALKKHATDNEITVEEKTMFGTRYVIEGAPGSPRWNVVECSQRMVY